MAGYDPLAAMELEQKRQAVEADKKHQEARALFENEMRSRIPSRYRDRSVRPLVFHPDVRLAKPCTEVEMFDGELRELAADMIFTMYMCGGVGLAAPQVGISKRMLVADWGETRGEPVVMVNPVVVSSESSVKMVEACLSMPGVKIQVTRPERITVRFHDERGVEKTLMLDGWPARVAQHEIDHLDGVMMTGRVGRLERQLALKSAKKIARGERPVAKPTRRR